ncbi:MAG: acyl-CoA synthetase [Saprospiraceae bacterium]
MQNTLYQTDWCARWALYAPHKIALKEWETKREISYGALNDAGNALADALTQNHGLRKGDRVAVLADFCIEYLILFVAAQKCGIVIVPLNYRLAAPELRYMLLDSRPALFFAEEKYTALAAGALGRAKRPLRRPLEDIAEIWRHSKGAASFAPLQFGPKDPIFILYTSGSTGFPKGALYTHKMLFWNSINTAMSLIINTESRALSFAPPFHTGAWNVLTTPFLHHGAYTCILKKFEPALVLELLQTERCTLLFGVPTMLKMMADEPAFAHARFPDLHYAIVGGEAMPLPLIETWTAKGVPIRQGYGMTEVGPNLTSLHQDDALRKRGSIGRPNYYVQTRIVNDLGGDCASGEAGELWVAGPMCTPGYWQNPGATRAAFSGEWFRTGDLVRSDEEGYLYVVDRLKNMYISGAENVYPAEVERVLLTHPDVSEAAVIGVPDEKWGEAGRAYLVLKPGALADIGSVMGHCRERLAKYKIPRDIFFVSELPKNDSGKINRLALKKLSS